MRRDKAREFQQIRGTEPTLTGCQRGDSVFGGEVSPTQWNLALAALLVEETYSLFAAMLFPTERFKLTTGERVKGMGDAKLLWFYSTNACSATPLLWLSAIACEVASGSSVLTTGTLSISVSTRFHPGVRRNRQSRFTADGWRRPRAGSRIVLEQPAFKMIWRAIESPPTRLTPEPIPPAPECQVPAPPWARSASRKSRRARGASFGRFVH